MKGKLPKSVKKFIIIQLTEKKIKIRIKLTKKFYKSHLNVTDIFFHYS